VNRRLSEVRRFVDGGRARIFDDDDVDAGPQAARNSEQLKTNDATNRLDMTRLLSAKVA